MTTLVVKNRLVKLFWSFLLLLVLFALALHVFFSTDSNHSADLYFKAPPTEMRVREKRKPVIVEKYNEHIVRARLMQEKVNMIKQMSSQRLANKLYENDAFGDTFYSNFTNIQILYHAPVKWVRTEKHIDNFNRIYNNTYVLYKDQKEYVNVAFYPQKGFYETTTDTLMDHFREIQSLGINALIWNWDPSIKHETAMAIFETLSSMKMKCSIQIDNYERRTTKSLRENLNYFFTHFESYSCWNKYYVMPKKQYLPLFYVKEAYQLPLNDLKELLIGAKSIRKTAQDAIMIGHFTLDTTQDKSTIRRSGFDGFYSYSAVNGAHFTSTWKNWAATKLFARTYDLLFVPTVAPGYQDKQKERNIKFTSLRHRSNGEYYGVGWRTARAINAQFIMINSYNNFVEGTHIEASIKKPGYADFGPYDTDHYLKITRFYVKDFYTEKLASIPKTCDDLVNNTVC